MKSFVLPLDISDGRVLESYEKIKKEDFLNYSVAFLSDNVEKGMERSRMFKPDNVFVFSNMTKLFSAYQKFRTNNKEKTILCILDLSTQPVSRIYNKMFKNELTGMIAVSEVPAIVKDHRYLPVKIEPETASWWWPF